MLRIFASFAIFAAVIASWFYLYSGDPDGAKCDQTCVADLQKSRNRSPAWPIGDPVSSEAPFPLD